MLIAFVIIAVLAVWVIIIYNKLITLRNNRENAFADIDVQLKMRHDLIPNLVAAVKQYAGHEKELFESITKARAAAMNANSIDDKIKAENALSSALGGINVAVENYPDLKASTNFLQLQEELADVENKIAASRRFFNGATKEYNVGIEVFPQNLFAGMFGHSRQPMFDVGEETRAEMNQGEKVEF